MGADGGRIDERPGLFESDGVTALDAPNGTIGGTTQIGSQGKGYIIRWTAPATGFFNVDANLWNLLDSGNFNRYEIRRVDNSGGSPATTVLERGGIALPDQGVTSAHKMPVSVVEVPALAGDYIDLFLARADGVLGEFVGVDLTISVGAPTTPTANYLHSAAADFYADFVNDLPQNNPNGDWTYLGPNNVPSDLEAHADPGSVAGAGTGWRVTAAAGGGPLYSYSRGKNPGFTSEPNSILGHGPMVVKWTAPAEVDLGGVQITGLLTQADFEPLRQMEMKIYKNDSVDPVATVDADFVNQRAIVPLSAQKVAIKPGDTLTIIVDGAGPLGNGVPTFASWDVVIEEIDPQINADFNADYAVTADDLPLWRTGLGALGGATQGQGDADRDTDVDGADFLLWQRQLGNSIPSGYAPFVYHPGAIIVQPSGVQLPDGSMLDISGSQTQGLQEAFAYSANEGFDVFVLPGAYTLNAHIDIEELQDRTFRFEDATLNFTNSVTDYGIRFDSTMITDVYWRGEALNAPNATNGILFQPRTPHPLDGEIYGTVGVVDSRFDFSMDITAKTHRVTMSTGLGPVNDAVFHFNNIARNQVNFSGSGFSPTNMFVAGRTDDAIPFDLFSTAGRVTVIAPLGQIFETGPGSIAQVVKPDGTLLNTFGTKTSGLKEAFAYAAANNLDLLVFGRGVRNLAPHSQYGYYNTNDTIVVGPLNNRIYEIYDSTFNYTQSGVAMEMSDIVSSQFELTGQIVAPNASIGVRIKPTTSGVLNSEVRIQHVVAAATNVLIDPSLRSVENSKFYLHEMNIGQAGIIIANPSPSTFYRNNLLRTIHTHGMTNVGVQVGQSAANAANINSNTFEIRVASGDFGGSMNLGLDVWGALNTFDYITLGPNLSVGAKYQSSSNGNATLFGPIQASTQVTNLGVNNTFTLRSATAAATPQLANVRSESDQETIDREGSSAAAALASTDIASTTDLDALAAAVVDDGQGLLRRPYRPRLKHQVARDVALQDFGNDQFRR